MIQAEKNYINGTSARKIDYNVYEENTVLKQKRKAKINSKIKTKMVFGIIVAFALGFIIMSRYATITQLNYSVDKYNNVYNELQNKNARLEVEIQENTDLNKVKLLAEQKLGMQKPDKYQIVYVNVPKTDFTKVAEKYSGDVNTDKSSSFSTVIYKVAKFVGFI